MNIIIWVVIIIIIIVNILIICFLVFNDTSYGKEFIDSNVTKIDILYHVSATNQNLLGYLNLIDVQKYDFISLVNLGTNLDEFNYISSVSDKPKSYIKFKDAAVNNTDNVITNVTTDNNQYIQGFTELKHLSNFNAVSLKHSIPISKYTFYTDKDKKCLEAYTRNYKRLSDKMSYVFCQININNPDIDSFSYLKSLLAMIANSNDLPKMFVGNFNIHGHEKVFNEFFKDYLICPMYKTLTVNNTINGYAALDGLVVSKKLYKTIKFKVDFSKSDIDRYVLIAHLYQNGIINIIDDSDYKFKNYVTYLQNNKLSKIGNEGLYDTEKTPLLTIVSNTDELDHDNPKNFSVYSNSTLNKKINTIEIMNKP